MLTDMERSAHVIRPPYALSPTPSPFHADISSKHLLPYGQLRYEPPMRESEPNTPRISHDRNRTVAAFSKYVEVHLHAIGV